MAAATGLQNSQANEDDEPMIPQGQQVNKANWASKAAAIEPN